MGPLRDAIAAGGELFWRQPKALQQDFELHAGPEETVVATLRWQKAFGTLAVAETPEGSWTFKRSGFWRPHVTVRVAGSEVDRAIFEPTWTGSGTLTIIGGPTFRWNGTNFWQTRWDWQTPDGAPLVHFSNRQGFVRLEGQVGVEAGALTLPELGLLIPLGWYLLVLHSHDATATTATTATTTAAVIS